MFRQEIQHFPVCRIRDPICLLTEGLSPLGLRWHEQELANEVFVEERRLGVRNGV
jgi:hypothetical protein